MKNRNLGIKSKLTLLFLAVLTSFLVLSVLYGVLLLNNEKYRDFNDEVLSVKVEYYQLRQFEQQFLLQSTEDEIFYKTGQSEYLRKFETSYKSLIKKLEELSKHKISNKLELSERIEIVKENLVNYSSTMLKLSRKFYQRGSGETGIIGELELANQHAFDNARNEVLREYVLKMNQQKNQYLFQGDETAFTNFINTFTELNNFIRLNQNLPGLSQDSLSFDSIFVYAPQSTDFQGNYIKNINEFKKNFSSLIKIDKEIGQSFDEGIRGDLQTEIAKFDDLEQIFVILTKAKEETNSRTKRNFIILSILVLGLLSIVFVQFNQRLLKPIQLLKSYIEPLSKGILPGSTITINTGDELTQMSNDLNDLVAGLRKTTSFAATIGSGVFETEFHPLSTSDVLGNSLLEMRKNLQEARNEEEKRKYEDSLRKWSNEGLARFAEILRQSTSSISVLSNNIIKNLIHFLDANQGGLFLYNDSNKSNIHLELIASFAYNQERKKKKVIYMGEGLIGTCAIEKAPIYMTELPHDYLTINSGLGGANPVSLLIVPLKVEEQIFGVIEIASFKKMEQYEIEFVEKVSESIASTLSIARINQRTAELLEQSQQQAEEMAAQEEEMRQNLEELQATQEESARKEAEMQSILNAINSSSLVVEYDLKGKIINVNQAVLNMLRLTREQLVGRFQGDFESMDEEHVRTLDFWERIRDGEIISKTQRIKVGTDNFWLHEVYTPIVDADGFPYKILNLATDITSTKQQEQTLIEQAEEMAAQEEEMRQNLEELQTTQEQMLKQQEEVELMNRKLQANDQILRKALEKSKLQEKQLQEQNEELTKREGFLNSKMSELEILNKEISEKQTEIENQNKRLKEREKELAIALDNALKAEERIKERNMQLVASEEEIRQNMEELQATQEQLEQQQSELTQVNKELARREAEMAGRLQAINQTNLLAEYNLDGTIIRINDKYTDMLGYLVEDLIGKNQKMIITVNDRKSAEYKDLWRKLKAKETVEGEFKRLCKDGVEVFVRVVLNPIFDEKGNPYKVMEIGQDITSSILQRIEIESQIKAINDTNIFIELTADGTILEANDNYFKVSGYTSSDVLKKNIKHIITEEFRKSAEYNDLWLDLRNGLSVSNEYVFTAKDNSEVYLHGVFTPVSDINGHISKVLFVAFDITVNKLQEESLKLQTKELSAQEEEFRQNLEALYESQKDMEFKQQLLEKNQLRMAELENENAGFGFIINNYKQLLVAYLTELEEFNESLTKSQGNLSKQKYTEMVQKITELINETRSKLRS